MSVTVSASGDLCIPLWPLIDAMSSEAKVQLAEALSCDSCIVKHVTDQILDGQTEGGSSGAESCVAEAEPQPFTGLSWAKRQVARRAGEVAATEIARLERALAAVERELRELRDTHAYYRGFASDSTARG